MQTNTGTQDDLLEAFFEIMDRYFKWLEQQSLVKKVEDKDQFDELSEKEKEEIKEKIKESVKDLKEELSEKAQNLMVVLKDNPETTKSLMVMYGLEKVEQDKEQFSNISERISMRIDELKGSLDLNTEHGRSKLDQLNKIQEIQLEKDSNMNEKIYKLLNLARENLKDNESNNALALAERLIDKYGLEKQNDIHNEMPERIESEVKDIEIDEKIKVNDYEVVNSEGIPENESDSNKVNTFEETVYIDESKYVEVEHTGNDDDNKTKWALESTVTTKKEIINLEDIPTSQKIKEMQQEGIDISKMHSKVTINKEYEKFVTKDITKDDGSKTNESTKEKSEKKEEVAIER